MGQQHQFKVARILYFLIFPSVTKKVTFMTFLLQYILEILQTSENQANLYYYSVNLCAEHKIVFPHLS